MINDKEKLILQAWLDEWDSAGQRLPGCVSYQAAFDLVTKLGLECPKGLAEIMDGTFERNMRARAAVSDAIDEMFDEARQTKDFLKALEKLRTKLEQIKEGAVETGRTSATAPPIMAIPETTKAFG